MSEIKELLLIDGVLYEKAEYNSNEDPCSVLCDYYDKCNPSSENCPIRLEIDVMLKKPPLQAVDLREELIKYTDSLLMADHLKNLYGNYAVNSLDEIMVKLVDEYLTKK
jgi:hypothetical protein